MNYVIMKRNWIYLVVIVIGVLLLVNSLLTQYNNGIIKQNKKLQEESAVIESYYDQIGKVIIQALDIGLRGYAIVGEESLATPMKNAILWKDSILYNVESPLQKKNYDLKEFRIFSDSLDAYVKYCVHLKQLVDDGQYAEFKRLFRSDIGRNLYGQYIHNEKSIRSFLSKIDREAEEKYQEALIRNYQLQVVLFLICFPTLLYTAFFTRKTFKLSEQLRHVEEDKNRLLMDQNIYLELSVADRIKEIAAQNEELAFQRDALSLQNISYQEAQKTIEEQNQQIISKNRELEMEVGHRTEELRDVNRELLEQNSQLEQFAFISAHNLRAPVARMLGLANLITMARTPADKDFAIETLIATTRDMDRVIKDLSQILDTKRYIGNHVEIDLQTMLTSVLNLLETEIRSTGTRVEVDFAGGSMLITSISYLESILYNLLHNAIKYRSFERKPVIVLRTKKNGNYTMLSISDNGLGIDLGLYGQAVFNLYKRFHLHVEGKGMGLFLVKSQIMALGGKVEIESELNVGTTFHVYFKSQ